MKKETATEIVKGINPDALEVIINDLLEKSRASDYRPYWVAAKTLFLNPPNANLKEADDVTWFHWKDRIEGLIETQASLDQGLTDIPGGTEAINPLESLPVSAISSVGF